MTARAEAALTDAASFKAAADAKQAVIERDTLEQAARVADRATEPLSVFVSRKERRVFVRQGFEPVFEADVEILEPELPLGTHVYTAVQAPAEQGAMKWVALSIPSAVRNDEPRSSRAGGVVQPATLSTPAHPATSSDEIRAAVR